MVGAVRSKQAIRRIGKMLKSPGRLQLEADRPAWARSTELAMTVQASSFLAVLSAAVLLVVSGDMASARSGKS